MSRFHRFTLLLTIAKHGNVALPKVLHDALKKLASLQDVRNIEHLVYTALEHLHSDENSGVVELSEGHQVEMDWKEGIEDLTHLSEDDLWASLGLPNKKLLFFQEYTDPDTVIEPWTEEGEKWLADPTSTREQLRPRWHQLVSIFRMLQCAFDDSPVLLMDSVSIGKTFQVIGFIACLGYYVPYYDKSGRFPGFFSKQVSPFCSYITDTGSTEEKKWQGRDGNIPDLPFIISYPVNLHTQWMWELE